MPYEPHIDKVLNKIASGEETSEAEQLLKLQANRQLMNEHKKVSQMTDLEKQLYAELNQKEIDYNINFGDNTFNQITKTYHFWLLLIPIILLIVSLILLFRRKHEK